MKKKIVIKKGKETVEKEIIHIPFRFILAMFFVVFETAAIIAGVVLLTLYILYAYASVVLTQRVVAVCIIGSNDNPDYKLPWLFLVMLIPIIGFMLYFMFYSRKLSKKQRRRINRITAKHVYKDDSVELNEIKEINSSAALQACALKNLSDTHVYGNPDIRY